MRNGILSLMGEIVVKVLCKEDLDDAAKKLRDQLLDKMEVSVFTLNWFLKKRFSCTTWLYVNYLNIISQN